MDYFMFTFFKELIPMIVDFKSNDMNVPLKSMKECNCRPAKKYNIYIYILSYLPCVYSAVPSTGSTQITTCKQTVK